MGCGTSTAAGSSHAPAQQRGRQHRERGAPPAAGSATERNGTLGESSSQSGDSTRYASATLQQHQSSQQHPQTEVYPPESVVTLMRSPSRQSPASKTTSSSSLPIHGATGTTGEERRRNPLAAPSSVSGSVAADVDGDDDDRRRDSDLSDISSTATEEATSNERSMSSSGLLFHRAAATGSSHGNPIGPDLAKERETAAPPSIEDEFFEYDDLKIATDVAKSKLWRVAGRKPVLLGGADFGSPPNNNNSSASSMTALSVGGPSGNASGSAPLGGSAGAYESKRRDSKAKANKFVFADFTVDEVDMLEALQPRGGGGLSSKPFGRRQSAADSGGSSVSSSSSSASVGGGASAAVASSQSLSTLPSKSVSGNTTNTSNRDESSESSSGSGGGLTTAVATSSSTSTSEKLLSTGGVEGATVDDALLFQLAPIPETSNARQLRLLEESMRPKRRPNTDYCEVKHVEVTNRIGHASRVKCIAIAPGEKEFVSCSIDDASATLSSVSSGREIGIFTGHHDTVIYATFSPDGKYLATTSRDHTMILWDVVTAKQLLTFDHAKVVICAAFSRDARYVATGCQDKVCRVWETRRGRECLSFAQHDGIVISMSYTPDGTHIASASADKTVRLWSTTTGKCRLYLTGHQGIVLACHCTSDGKFIVSNDEKLLRVWKIADGSCTLSLAVDEACGKFGHHHGLASAMKKLTWTLSCVAPGEFSHYIVVACNNRFVYVLDVVSGEEVYHTYCKAPVYCLATGQKNRVSFGDSFGNVYFMQLR